MPYIDGFVIAVPTANKQQFIAHANQADSLFIEHGATRVVECWGADVPKGKTKSGGWRLQPACARPPSRGLRADWPARSEALTGSASASQAPALGALPGPHRSQILSDRMALGTPATAIRPGDSGRCTSLVECRGHPEEPTP